MEKVDELGEFFAFLGELIDRYLAVLLLLHEDEGGVHGLIKT
jgi:hypothetical protein